MIGIYETLKLTQVQGHKVIGQGHNLQESTFGSMKMYIWVKQTRLINLRGVNVLVYLFFRTQKQFKVQKSCGQ